MSGGKETVIGLLLGQATALLRGELALAKAEFDRALHHLVYAIVLAVFAAVLGLGALNFASDLLVQLLITEGWSEMGATGLVAGLQALGALICLIAGALLLRGVGFTARARARARRY